MNAATAWDWGSRGWGPVFSFVQVLYSVSFPTLRATPLWELPQSLHLTNEGAGSDEWFSNIFAHRAFLQKKCYPVGESAPKQVAGVESDGARTRWANRGFIQSPCCWGKALVLPQAQIRLYAVGSWIKWVGIFLRKMYLVVLIIRQSVLKIMLSDQWKQWTPVLIGCSTAWENTFYMSSANQDDQRKGTYLI